jgi:quinol monooxygenase YgiN
MADVATRLPDTGELNIVVTRRIHPGKEAEVEILLKEAEAATIAHDKGCLRYEWYRVETPHTYILLERWTDRAAVEAHLQAPHMVSIRRMIAPLVPGDFTFVSLTRI